MRHTLKIQEQFADAIVSGDKMFEVRKNERAYQKGDTVQFTAYDGTGVWANIVVGHDINHTPYEITYVLSGWGIEAGYVVFGIREVNDA